MKDVGYLKMLEMYSEMMILWMDTPCRAMICLEMEDPILEAKFLGI